MTMKVADGLRVSGRRPGLLGLSLDPLALGSKALPPFALLMLGLSF